MKSAGARKPREVAGVWQRSDDAEEQWSVFVEQQYLLRSWIFDKYLLNFSAYFLWQCMEVPFPTNLAYFGVHIKDTAREIFKTCHLSILSCILWLPMKLKCFISLFIGYFIFFFCIYVSFARFPLGCLFFFLICKNYLNSDVPNKFPSFWLTF